MKDKAKWNNEQRSSRSNSESCHKGLIRQNITKLSDHSVHVIY